MSQIKKNYLPNIAFLIIIFVIPILHVLFKDKTFSFIENRYLSKFPKLSIESLISGEFNNKLSSYLEDHFPFRDEFITLKSSFELLIGRRDINDVYISKNGYLIESFRDLDLKVVNNNLNLINNLSKNYKVSLMLIPTSSEILKDYLPPYSLNIDQVKLFKYLKNELNSSVKFIDPTDILNAHKDEYIYYKTDHHYTTLGAYYSYLEFAEQNNIFPLNKEDFSIQKVSDKFLGSLFSKINLNTITPDEVYLFHNKKQDEVMVDYLTKKSNSLYEFSYLDNPRNHYNIFLDNNHPLIKINTSTKNNKKLCIIKDSYANSFIPFLVNHFEEIHVIDLRFYSKNIINYLDENNLEEVLIYYNIKNFCEDKNLIFIKQN
ncbi:DHHW family protein [Candidatus Arthromitus sp. SFB-rat-Yit]|uniref:DHHW family protein n=1 Tax=Candidatus Arthromitus sp. SFB-rat-Yit TaxID=1041504 RepID=UPI000227A62D|nr:DHHW family protein [Candidatus Arthromitus sp. SFB-rat-Yit]BAK80587.1 hypothetical protein RATSFB_0025 [Candidatus Arthromitus sp. SFB-rat-Yit]